MPFVSGAQKRAMYAAAHGKSTLGIPKLAALRFIRHAVPVKHVTKPAPMSVKRMTMP